MRRRWRRNTSNYPKRHNSSPIGEGDRYRPPRLSLTANFCKIPIGDQSPGSKR